MRLSTKEGQKTDVLSGKKEDTTDREQIHWSCFLILLKLKLKNKC